MKKKNMPKGAGQKPGITPAVQPVDPKVEAAVTLKEGLTRGETLHVTLFTLVTFLATVVITGRVATVLAILFVLLSLRKSSFANAREHFSLPMVGIFLMMVLYIISAIYSPFGETAELELYRGMAAFSLAGYALLRFRKQHMPALLWSVVIVATCYSFFSLDMSASRIFFNVLNEISAWLGNGLLGIETMNGTRLNAIHNNSNVLASTAALAMILGLHHLQTEEERWKKLAAALCLGINAMVFWLSQSRGGMLCFAVAMVVYLVLIQREKRLHLLLLMIVCVVTTIALSTVALRHLGNHGGSIVADLLVLVCGAVIFLLDSLVCVPMSILLVKRQKILAIAIGVVSVCCVGAIVCLLNVSGAYTFTEENLGVGRMVSLMPGQTYTVSGDWDGSPAMNVVIERKSGLLLDQYEIIYEGSLMGAKFTLPEDTATVMLYFGGDQPGNQLREVVFSDGTKVKLNRVLLPESIEQRLQDNILTSSSFLLRVQYIKDALKIWAGAPLFGRGLSSTDNLYTAVQPVFYMTKFVHCHIVQYLADMGIIGLCNFLLIVAGLVWLLLRKWKLEQDDLAVALLTVLVMMNLHSFTEINFSVRAYGIMAYVLLAVMAIGYGEPLLMKSKNAVKRAANAAVTVMLAVTAITVGICISTRVVEYRAADFQSTSHEEFMVTIEKYIKWNALDDDYFKILYIAQCEGQPQYEQKVAEYASILRKSGTFTNCDAVARYYYMPRGMLKDLFACSMEGIAQKASDKDAWNGELDFYRATVLKVYSRDWANAQEPFLEGVLAVRDYLNEYSTGRLEEIELSEENKAFLAEVEAVWKDGSLSHEEVYVRLSQYSEAASEA